MRFTCGDVREPYRFIQNRSRISVVPLKSDAAAEKPKGRLSRDFLGCSIFDFCNNICQERTPAPRDAPAGTPNALRAVARPFKRMFWLRPPRSIRRGPVDHQR